MKSNTKLNPLIYIFAALSAVFYCTSCGGDLSIEEGPNLKAVLDEKEAELAAVKTRNTLVANIENCEASSQLLKSSIAGPVQFKIEDILPRQLAVEAAATADHTKASTTSSKKLRKAISITGQNLSAAQITQALASLLEPRDAALAMDPQFQSMRSALAQLDPNDLTQTAVVVRAKCLRIEPETTLNSFGHDLYITADKVSLQGRIQTTFGAKDAGADLKIVSLKLDVGDTARVSTTKITREGILSQIKQQASLGQSNWLAVNMNSLETQSYKSVDDTRVMRNPGTISPFDDERTISGHERARRDADKIFETFFVGKFVTSSGMEPGSLAWQMGKDRFHELVQSGKFSEVFSRSSNADAWRIEFNRFVKNIENGFYRPNTVGTLEGSGETNNIRSVNITERATEEQLRSSLDFELQGVGSIEIIYAIGTKASDLKGWLSKQDVNLMTPNKDQLFYFLNTSRPFVNRNRTIEAKIRVNCESSTSPNTFYDFERDFSEDILVPTEVEIRSVFAKEPKISQDIDDYRRAFKDLGLPESSQLDETVVPQLKLLISKER